MFDIGVAYFVPFFVLVTLMYPTKLENGERILIEKLLNVNEGVACDKILRSTN